MTYQELRYRLTETMRKIKVDNAYMEGKCYSCGKHITKRIIKCYQYPRITEGLCNDCLLKEEEFYGYDYY